MPRISGQNGARIITSSPGSTSAPTAWARPAVAPPVTSTDSRSHAMRLRARTFSTIASTSGGMPCVAL
jgi:hypothetical protein